MALSIGLHRGGASALLLLCGIWHCQNAPAPAPAPAPVEHQTAAVAPFLPNVDKDYLMGKFDPATHPDFERVGAPYSQREGMIMRKEAFEAFKKMWDAAKKDGVTLNIISSTRNFNQQKNIWEGKWKRFAQEAPEPEARALKILEYSSMPGSSRHHWGTDVDLNDLNNAAFESGGKYEKVYVWLTAHAHEYGFCQPYTQKGPSRPHGYNEERWHWSYEPLSKPFLTQYKASVHDEDFQGFEGWETAKDIQIIAHYVSGIGQCN